MLSFCKMNKSFKQQQFMCYNNFRLFEKDWKTFRILEKQFKNAYMFLFLNKKKERF